MQQFKNPSHPIKLLILLYKVGAQGVNLDPCCNRVLVATEAINASLEIQVWGRVIRVKMSLPYRFEGALDEDVLQDHYKNHHRLIE